jgi:hypothetical protein
LKSNIAIITNLFRVAVITVLISAFAFPLYSFEHNKGFITGLTGTYLAPTGFYTDYFNPGAGFGAALLYYPGMYGFFLEGNANFASFAIKGCPNSTMSQYTLTAGPGLSLGLAWWFEPFVSLQFGANHMRLDLDRSGLTETSTKPLGIATAGLMVSPFEYISVRMGASYGVSTLSGERFYTSHYSVSAMMRTTVFTARNILERKESLLHLVNIRLKPVFGARYAGYGSSGIGVATIKNNSGETVTDVRIETAINEIASGPTKSVTVKSLAPGNSTEVDLPLEISREILSINETRDLPVKMRTYYTCSKGVFSYIETGAVKVYSRNALTWNNLAHIGSFITPREDTAISFSRNAISLYKQKMLPGYNRKLQESLIIFNALGAAGISYASDPNYGFTKRDGDSIDYVMFPGETLQKKAGDCDDLTVLYASLLEAVGVRTAVIATPGHIFMMFDTEVPQNSYADITEDRSLLYFMNGTSWIPVEVTMTGKTFLAAWREGAKSVEKHRLKAGEMEILETAGAWAKYPPADIESKSVPIQSMDRIETFFNLDMEELKAREFDGPSRKHLADLGNVAREYTALNSLGILSAKHGKLDDAFSWLKKAMDKYPGKSPAYINLGNVYMLKREYDGALPLYEKAVTLDPGNHRYRISLARACFESGKRVKARDEYRAALRADPGYARRYAYLDGAPDARAADPGERAEYNMWER